MRSLGLIVALSILFTSAAAQPQVVVREDANRGDMSVSTDGHVFLSDEVSVTKYDGELNEIWSVAVEEARFVEAGNDGTSYVFGGETNVILGAQGSVIDTFANGITIKALRVGADGTVYAAGTQSSHLWIAKLDEDAKEVWSHEIPFSRSPAYWDGFASEVAVDVDAAGSMWIAGSFSETLDLGEANELIAAGENDVFLLKYDVAGSLANSMALGSSGADIAYDLFVDDAGNAYVTGLFDEPIDFDPGSSSAILESPACVDAFLASYDSEGQYRWAGKIGGADSCAEAGGFSLARNGEGGFFVSGYFFDFADVTVDFDAGPSVVTASYVGEEDAFVARYSDTGAFEWVEGLGSPGLDAAIAVDANADGDFFLLGYAGAPVDLVPNSSSGPTVDGVFLAKFEGSGRLATHVERPTKVARHDLEVYPNPFSEAVALRLPQACSGTVDVDLVDMLGRQISLLRERFDAADTRDISLSVSDVPNGVYLLTLTGDGCRMSQPLVRRR